MDIAKALHIYSDIWREIFSFWTLKEYVKFEELCKLSRFLSEYTKSIGTIDAIFLNKSINELGAYAHGRRKPSLMEEQLNYLAAHPQLSNTAFYFSETFVFDDNIGVFTLNMSRDLVYLDTLWWCDGFNKLLLSCSKLEYLSIRKTANLSPSSIKSCMSLKTLKLSGLTMGNEVTDALLSLSGLKCLKLGGVKFENNFSLQLLLKLLQKIEDLTINPVNNVIFRRFLNQCYEKNYVLNNLKRLSIQFTFAIGLLRVTPHLTDLDLTNCGAIVDLQELSRLLSKIISIKLNQLDTETDLATDDILRHCNCLQYLTLKNYFYIQNPILNIKTLLTLDFMDVNCDEFASLEFFRLILRNPNLTNVGFQLDDYRSPQYYIELKEIICQFSTFPNLQVIKIYNRLFSYMVIELDVIAPIFYMKKLKRLILLNFSENYKYAENAMIGDKNIRWSTFECIEVGLKSNKSLEFLKFDRISKPKELIDICSAIANSSTKSLKYVKLKLENYYTSGNLVEIQTALLTVLEKTKSIRAFYIFGNDIDIMTHLTHLRRKIIALEKLRIISTESELWETDEF